MELYDYNIEDLKKIWVSKQKRQHAQLVILTAIGRTSEVTIAQAHAILAELDDILVDKDEEKQIKGDRAI
jgi:hypothetical protein